MKIATLCVVTTFVLLLTHYVSASRVTFTDHKVLRVTPSTSDQRLFLTSLFLTNTSLDFWTEPALVGDVDIRVTPEQYEWLSQELSRQGITWSVWINDVESLVQQQMEGRDKLQPQPVGAIDYTVYHTYDEVIAWVKTLPTSYPNLVTLVNLGKSYEGRELLAVKVTSTKNTNPKPAIWFDGCIHAREWITTATVIYMLGHMLDDYGGDPTITTLIDNSEIFVLPVFNTDGYVYTWTTNRMWRKTRSPNSGSSCVGTDPNRNWDFQWGGAGTSTDPCSDSFCGASAFSEIEVKTVGLYIKNAGNFKGYINFHSYSQLWMSPWGYTSTLPPDYQIQNTLSGRCVSALTEVYGTQYQYGPIATTIYPASGSSADYTYGAGKVLFSYGVELRDTGEYGFLLPPNQIVPSGVETYAALKVWAQAAIKA
eukprot:TRINITY_DN18433_c0_g1_i1.p1 TRINITY_DN18433_c0_g1~~TRINITY_DN18433_c0_g1_i1.p1  ORF type:complete len:424 (+),score=80.92 TRINITY_DN18433_c0_g1_i1:52-1323(+)